MSEDDLTFDQFYDEWIKEVVYDNPSTSLLGQRFAKKLLVQAKELDPESMNVLVLDGSGDGGIDVAYLSKGDDEEDENQKETGDSWLLLQGKHGSSFLGKDTIIEESDKFFNNFFMKGSRSRLSEEAQKLFDRLDNFVKKADPKSDSLVWLIGTDRSLTEGEIKTLNDVREKGRKLFGPYFNADSISVESIYNRQREEEPTSSELIVPLNGNLVDCIGKTEGNLLVGSVPLLHIYDFLKSYREKTSDLDMLYEKNVRKFLGIRRKVNKAIRETLEKAPDLFGLYNNGITIVASDIRKGSSDNELKIVNPFVVNGCQTTKIIWEVFQQTIESGGSAETPEYKNWYDQVKNGVVLTKIVKVGSAGDTALRDITKYTNSQTSVSEKDFIALDQGFQNWSAIMRDQYGIFLEIQRGGWDSQKARQKNRPDVKPLFNEYANAFDLIKVYSAGWLGEAGTAYGKNGPFAPGGYIFKRLTEPSNSNSEKMSVDDLYAAHRLKKEADRIGFGRGEQLSRRQTRYLFYFVMIELLRGVLRRKGMSGTNEELTKAFLKVVEDPSVLDQLMSTALDLIDEYVSESGTDTIFNEPGFKKAGKDLHAFLRSSQIGKSKEESPILIDMLSRYNLYMGGSRGRQKSIRDVLWDCIQAGPLA